MVRKWNFKSAFTLIELLVVIAIIALLLAILIPSLNLAKRKAATAVCLVNTKNLSTGWYLYKEDNDSWIMSSHMDRLDVDDKTNIGWIGTPRDNNGTFLNCTGTNTVTDDDEIRGIEAGVLYEYLEAPDAYHCPADTLRKSIKGDGGMVFVSYVVPSCFYDHNKNSQYFTTQIRKFTDITSPGTRYVFVESAEERNWNMAGHFVLGAPEYTGNFDEWAWWGPMAINHGASSILGYADGHSTSRKWRDPFTRERVYALKEGRDNFGIESPPAGQTQDIEFMAAGWAYRHKKSN